MTRHFTWYMTNLSFSSRVFIIIIIKKRNSWKFIKKFYSLFLIFFSHEIDIFHVQNVEFVLKKNYEKFHVTCLFIIIKSLFIASSEKKNLIWKNEKKQQKQMQIYVWENVVRYAWYVFSFKSVVSFVFVGLWNGCFRAQILMKFKNGDKESLISSSPWKMPQGGDSGSLPVFASINEARQTFC